jgi:hypothetical protein
VNFHEKASLVKADVAAAMTVRVGYPCHASIRTLGELTLLGSSVHHKIRLFGYSKGAAIFRAVSTSIGWTKFACAVALL